MRNHLLFILGIALVGCSGADESGGSGEPPQGTPPAADAPGGPTSPTPGVPTSGTDAGPPQPGNTTPSQLTITGTVTPTCTHASAPNLDYDCHLVVTNLTVAPALPAGLTIQDAIDISSENRNPADTGWMPGLGVTAPSYPSSCFQTLSWGAKDSLSYTVFPYQPESKSSNCGLITAQHSAVSALDFTQGFSASLKAVYMPTGKLIDVKVMLRR